MSTLKGTRLRESDGDMPLFTQASRLDRATMRHFDKLSASHVRAGQLNVNALPVRGRVVRVEFGEGGERSNSSDKKQLILGCESRIVKKTL